MTERESYHPVRMMPSTPDLCLRENAWRTSFGMFYKEIMSFNPPIQFITAMTTYGLRVSFVPK